MVSVSYPRECAGNTDGKEYGRDEACDNNSIVIILVVCEDQNDSKDDPAEPGCSATGVDASDVLQNGCASKTEPQRSPLHWFDGQQVARKCQ